MIREDDNDMTVEIEFFQSRSRLKDPKPQKKPPHAADVPLHPEVTDLITNAKKKRRTIGNAYQHTRTGARPDLGGIVCRSAWESDVLRVLQLWNIKFEFEPKVFSFPLDAHGKASAYLPDIYLNKTDEFIEVKGMLDPRGRNKLRKFRKFYPEECAKLTVIISKSNKQNKLFFKKLGVGQILYMEHLTKLFANKIIMWESKK